MSREGGPVQVQASNQVNFIHRAFTLQATGVAMANATYIYISLGYQNIPVNLDEALRQIGRYLYGVQHHERAQRVTHSLEALDEGSGTEGREQGR